MKITDIIQPIKLLMGSHEDTGKTGRGCFMNVIAYLNGEPQITDRSPCVCIVVRPIAIWLNDFATQEQRAKMLPLIERAMGSRTEDKAELARRARLAADFAQECERIAAAKADAAEAAASAKAFADAANATKAVAYATDAAANAVYAVYAVYTGGDSVYTAGVSATLQRLFDAGLACLDAMLPPAQEPSECVIERAKWLAEIQS